MNPRDGHVGDAGSARRALAIALSNALRIREVFVDPCDTPRLAQALGQALPQRKPLRRCKDTLAGHPARRETRFAFERQAVEAIARPWRADHGITPPWLAHRRLPSS